MDANKATPGNDLLEIYSRLLDLDTASASEEDFLLQQLQVVRVTRELAAKQLKQTDGLIEVCARILDLDTALAREEHYILKRLEYVQETRHVVARQMSQADQLFGLNRNQLSD